MSAAISTSTELYYPVTDADHQQGPADAPVTLLEYGDYECPDCLNSEPIVQHLREATGDRLRVVFRHFPKNSIYQRSSAAAEAAEAAGAQGRFWDMHRALFKHQKELADLDLTHLALSIGLDVYRFQRDTESVIIPRQVQQQYEGGLKSGVKSTPTFFINFKRYTGPTDFASMRAAVEAAASGS